MSKVEPPSPSDILHFVEGMLYNLDKLVKRCPNLDFKGSLQFPIIDLAWKLKHWKKELEEKNERERM